MSLQRIEDDDDRAFWPIAQKPLDKARPIALKSPRAMTASSGGPKENVLPSGFPSARQPFIADGNTKPSPTSARYASEGGLSSRDTAKFDPIVKRGSRRISTVLAERSSESQFATTPRRASGTTPRRASTLPLVGETLSRRASLRKSSKMATVSFAAPDVEEESANIQRSNSMSNPEFAFLVLLSKKHGHPLEDVKKLWDDFNRHSKVTQGFMTFSEFEEAVRYRCNLPEDEPIPRHLVPEQIRAVGNRKGTLNFEVFLQWTIATAFAEEVMVPDRHERRVRKIARENSLAIDDVERVKVAFDQFDIDGSGFIDQKEFREVLKELASKKRGGGHTEPSDVTVLRYFKEVDHNSDGKIAFEEFVPWYWNVLG